jgi:cation transport ATPase
MGTAPMRPTATEGKTRLMARGRFARATSATAVAIVSLAALLTGIALWAAGLHCAADVVWAALIGVLLIPLGWSVARTLIRGDVGVDAIALISMCGALALQEYLAGAVIALMLAGGNALEERAGGRARRELTNLVSRSPRRATRLSGSELEEVAVEQLAPGDTVLLRAGEVVPADGVLDDEEAVIDESALTGEALPVVHRRGHAVRSGTVSTATTRIRVTRRAADSSYAAIVRLAQDAERQRAPFVRMADRYAAFFLPVTAVVAGIAWAASGDPVRALAVFVVATPCPLILAAPIALLSGVSRAARMGIVVKGGGVIERLGGARTVILDKTGTVTLGTPTLTRVGLLDGMSEADVLTLAASVDLVSLHPFAAALVREAQDRGLSLALPEDVAEQPGSGVEGTVDGHRVGVGSDAFLRNLGYEGTGAIDTRLRPGDARALIGVDGRLAAWFELADPPARARSTSPRGFAPTASCTWRCSPVIGARSPSGSVRSWGSTGSTPTRRRRRRSPSSGRSGRCRGSRPW